MSRAAPAAEADALCDEARLLFVRGDSRAALELLGRALGGRTEHLPALLLKAEVLLEERRGREALAAAELAVQTAPRSSEAWNALARGHHALRDDQAALSAAREAERLLPEGDNFRQAAPVYLTLVWCLREMRLFREALEAAEVGLARVPDAVLAQWAATVEDELAEAEQERC